MWVLSGPLPRSRVPASDQTELGKKAGHDTFSWKLKVGGLAGERGPLKVVYMTRST